MNLKIFINNIYYYDYCSRRKIAAVTHFAFGLRSDKKRPFLTFPGETRGKTSFDVRFFSEFLVFSL